MGGSTQRTGLPHCSEVLLASGGFCGGSHRGQSLGASYVTVPVSSEGDSPSAGWGVGKGWELEGRNTVGSRESSWGLVSLNVGHICRGRPTSTGRLWLCKQLACLWESSISSQVLGGTPLPHPLQAHPLPPTALPWEDWCAKLRPPALPYPRDQQYSDLGDG